MLWLAGLIGLAGVGAASFVGLKSTEVEEEEPINEEEFQQETTGNLLDAIQIQGEEDSSSQEPQTALNVPPAPGPGDTDGWGDDILNDIMADFQDLDAADSKQMGAFETNIQPLIFEDAMVTEAEESTTFDYSLTNWITERSGVEILDYSADDESLMLVWDDTDANAPEPDVDVAPDPDDPEVMQVSMNGENVAEVYGDAEMDASDLTLIPLSSAIVIGLMPKLTQIRPQNHAM